MIVIIAPEDDFHAIVTRHVLREEFSSDCEILELGAFPRSAQLSLAIDAQREHIRYRSEARRIDWSAVQAVWWRRPQLTFTTAQDMADDAAASEFAVRECSSIVMTLFSDGPARVVNRPHRQQRAACKGTQLVHAMRLSIPVPATLITNDRDEVDAFRQTHPACVFKVLTWFGERLIPTQRLTDEDLLHADALDRAPIIVQEQLPPGMDIRVNIFGTELFAAAKQVDSVDGRLDLALWEDHVLPDCLGRQLLELMHVLGLDYGCSDLRLLPDGRYIFLEVNPSGQFLMVERDTQQPLTRSLCRLLSADGAAATGRARAGRECGRPWWSWSQIRWHSKTAASRMAAFAPPRNSAAIPSSSRLALQAHRPSRCAPYS